MEINEWPEEKQKEYIDFLEQMVILLSKCYQETHDVLYEKLKNKETKVYLEVPTVQGTPLIFAIDKLSHDSINDGKINFNKLDDFIDFLIDKHKKQ